MEEELRQESPQEFHSTPQSAFSRHGWIFALIGVAAVVGLIFVYLAHRAVKQPARPDVRKPGNYLAVEQKNLPSAQIPDKFPTELVLLEAGAAVTENYTASADSRSEAVRVYQTERTIGELFKIYRDFFKNNGWTIGNSLDQERTKALSATKGLAKVIVTINENPTSGLNSVTVTASQIQK